jgi:chaperonin cofactor prefoldin
METSDARDEILECKADVENMDIELDQLTYQQQDIEQRLDQLKQMQYERHMQR